MAKNSSSVHRPVIWPIWIVLLLIIAAIALGGYYGWMYLQSLQQDVDASVQEKISSVESTAQQVRKDQSAFTSSLSTIQQQTQSFDDRIDDLSAQLDKTAQSMLADQATSRTDWLLAEAEYLLRLANQRILLEQDVESAVAILLAADQALKETDEVAVIPIRKTIASEMLALNSLGEVDVEGSYLSLEALTEQIAGMSEDVMLKESPLAKNRIENGSGLEVNPDAAESQSAEGSDKAAGQEPVPWYRRALDSAKTTLNRFVIVRDMEEPIAPLLAPEQTHYLRQNLRLMIEQAEAALLARNQAIYSRSLEKATTWIKSYFVEESPQTTALLDSIEKLQALNVNPELPDISGSLRQLKGLMQSVYKLGPAPASDQNGSEE